MTAENKEQINGDDIYGATHLFELIALAGMEMQGNVGVQITKAT